MKENTKEPPIKGLLTNVNEYQKEGQKVNKHDDDDEKSNNNTIKTLAMLKMAVWRLIFKMQWKFQL